jgi:hypothetical protein
MAGMRLRTLLAVLIACGGSVGCTSVEPGNDLQIADVVYDENFYYCTVEPMLFAQSCGPGNGSSDGTGSCHFNVTSFRLSDYTPLVATTCTGPKTPGGGIPPEASANYTSAQTKMQIDPNLAPLLNRPTLGAAHPRQIFSVDSPEADIIRQWATQFSTQ